MKLIAILLIAFLLFSMVTISGCVAPSSLNNQDDVSLAVSNISNSVEDIEGILNDLDQGLG